MPSLQFSMLYCQRSQVQIAESISLAQKHKKFPLMIIVLLVQSFTSIHTKLANSTKGSTICQYPVCASHRLMASAELEIHIFQKKNEDINE